MFDALKKCPKYAIFGVLVVALFMFLESRGYASGGSKAPQRVDPKQIRSTSTGSSTYVYWMHGSRGK